MHASWSAPLTVLQNNISFEPIHSSCVRASPLCMQACLLPKQTHNPTLLVSLSVPHLCVQALYRASLHRSWKVLGMHAISCNMASTAAVLA